MAPRIVSQVEGSAVIAPGFVGGAAKAEDPENQRGVSTALGSAAGCVCGNRAAGQPELAI